MKLKLPLRYDVDFSKEDKKYTFYSDYDKRKEALRRPLLEISRNYCMYGYDLITTGDRSTDGKLEHSIEHSIFLEKNGNKNPFHCKFNISIASENLNNSSNNNRFRK